MEIQSKALPLLLLPGTPSGQWHPGCRAFGAAGLTLAQVCPAAFSLLISQLCAAEQTPHPHVERLQKQGGCYSCRYPGRWPTAQPLPRVSLSLCAVFRGEGSGPLYF